MRDTDGNKAEMRISTEEAEMPSIVDSSNVRDVMKPSGGNAGRRCVRCGDCCRHVATGFTLDDVRNEPSFPDREFILKHWRPAEPPAVRLYPKLSDKRYKGFVWWSCDVFNAEKNLCKNYDDRPDICRNSVCPIAED